VTEFSPSITSYEDEDGHRFRYALVRNTGASTLGVHFSAFSNRPFLWGPNRSPRNAPGYFQRLRMLGSDPTHHWLFICEEFGADGDGTYYTGERGDFFVERAVRRIIRTVLDQLGIEPHETVMIGSSGGATGALKFALEFDCRGVVAICPHIDLDICAALQGRMAHVAFICPDSDPLSEANHLYTRQISRLLDGRIAEGDTLPHLYVQSCRDDHGVFDEQVVPLVRTWSKAGQVEFDIRPVGGHTSDWAPRALLLDAVNRILADEVCDVEAYQTDPRFAGTRTRTPLWLRTRYRLGDIKRALVRAAERRRAEARRKVPPPQPRGDG